ncbi:diacylglycerol kinase family protein [Sphaerisporangium sp. TRM90804]|uniref:diacylglycerol/lipid kinase family protein n=1 Tax=Sphaerisporangium sp. TRM90804 TaxID=3031113 RepID=UPI002448F791|nr:diacylglycerol kinase family protein [Sphaerisporangium sp. TRM90804]MDH2427057.1 diacylglycerol kinase family protein [Sphaerisporangium sp. TRM90804]
MARKIAVIAHQKKTFGGGLDQLRVLLAEHDVGKLLWHEVPKSKKAPKQVRKALKEGADLVFVWGGDGMVQRCSDAMAGSGVPMAVLPAGTANLFAANMGIPEDLPEAVRIGFQGEHRKLDLGVLNGEHFAVMAGAGFEAQMIADSDKDAKSRLGRLAYFKAAVQHVGGPLVPMKVKIDGVDWFDGPASCLLLGNVGTITGGIEAFDDARPDDGWLEVGVSTAQGPIQWARVIGKMATGRSEESPFVRITRGRKVTATFETPLTYELDGGDRDATTKIKAEVAPGALTLCVPEPSPQDD